MSIDFRERRPAVQPPPELVHNAASDFARRIAGRPEVISLSVSVENEAVVLWLQKGLGLREFEEDMETEVEFHQFAALTNDKYPDVYIELRIVNQARSQATDIRSVIPQDAERIALREVMSDINATEDTRPY